MNPPFGDAWLREEYPREHCAARRLRLLLAAARAAFFLESVEAEQPQLALTLITAGRLLVERLDRGRSTACAALEQYRAHICSGADISDAVTHGLHAHVSRLPPFQRDTEAG